jgi:hypothetical protein
MFNGKGIAAYAQWVIRMGNDPRLFASHVSLYAALFVSWQRSGFNNPFPVSRQELMSYSRIASIATYHKCIKELDVYGYISYQPSFNPAKGSLVYWPDENSDGISI